MTQEELATRLEISERQLGRYEAGDSELPKETKDKVYSLMRQGHNNGNPKPIVFKGLVFEFPDRVIFGNAYEFKAPGWALETHDMGSYMWTSGRLMPMTATLDVDPQTHVDLQSIPNLHTDTATVSIRLTTNMGIHKSFRMRGKIVSIRRNGLVVMDVTSHIQDSGELPLITIDRESALLLHGGTENDHQLKRMTLKIGTFDWSSWEQAMKLKPDWFLT